MSRHFPPKMDAHGLRHLKPDLPRGPYRGHFRSPNAGGEGSQGPVGGGVGIGTHYEHVRQDVALLGQNLMAYALSEIIEEGE